MTASGEIALLFSVGGLHRRLPYFLWPKILRGNRAKGPMGAGPRLRRRACASKPCSRTQFPQHFATYNMALYL